MKKSKKLIIGIIIFSMMAMYGSVPVSRAASLTSAKDVLSDSDWDALSNHTITFTHAIDPGNGGYFEVTLATQFKDILGDATCSGGGTVSTTTDTVRCTYAAGIAAGSNTITIANVQNPSVGDDASQRIWIRSYTSGNVVQEVRDVMVAILDNVTMTATVSATLQFTVSGTTTDAVINGVPVSNNSTATVTPFGLLNVGSTSTVAQDLSVITNADQGYIVTVYQDDELRNTTNSTINSFNNSADGTGSTTPQAWAAPLGVLDQTWTYGHMGLTVNDSNLDADLGAPGTHDFNGDKWVGLNGTSTQIIMSHTGPADGQTQNKGYASVLYQTEIHALQEAGDYTNTITYICTPTF